MSPLAIGAVAAAAGTVAKKDVVEGRAEEVREREEEIEDPVLKRYYEKYPGLLPLTKNYADAAQRATEKIAETATELLRTDSAETRQELTRALRTYEQVLAALRLELDRLDNLFKAWRATTLKTRVEEFEFVIPLDDLRGVSLGQDGGVSFAEDTPRAVRRLWDVLGVLVMIDSRQGDIDVPVADSDDLVFIRQPRRVQLSIYNKTDEKLAVLQSRKSYLVMDDRCEVQKLPFHKSLFGKRGQGLVFSQLGGLVGYTSKQTSEAAGFADTMAAVPGTVTGSLEQSKKFLDDVYALRSHGLDSRLATVKKQVELKQQEITESGLLATESSYAELEQLKQEAEILQQKKAIGDLSSPPDTNAALMADLRQQIELLKLKQELTVLTGGASDR
jgi:hypothetical protein